MRAVQLILEYGGAPTMLILRLSSIAVDYLERLCLSFLCHLYTQQGFVLCRTISIILEKQEQNEILNRARSRPKF